MILEGAGNDAVAGGGDVDLLDYSGVTGGVALSLGITVRSPPAAPAPTRPLSSRT